MNYFQDEVLELQLLEEEVDLEAHAIKITTVKKSSDLCVSVISGAWISSISFGCG